MRKLLLMLLLFTSLTCVSQKPVPFQDYYSGEYRKARPGLEKLARRGDARALLALSTLYFHGWGVMQNADYALNLLKKSAALNHVSSQMLLGDYYFVNKKDLVRAVKWYQRAALNGNVKAQVFMSIAYSQGFGVEKNATRAKRFIILSAKNGNPMAQYNLAVLFLGSKDKRTRRMGIVWLKKSVAQSYTDAEYRFGLMLYDGEKIERDKIKGLGLIKKAADHGQLQAIKTFALIKDSLQVSGTSDAAFSGEKVTDIKQQKAVQPWAGMMMALKQARVKMVLFRIPKKRSFIVQATPQLAAVTRKMVIHPEYRLMLPKEVPVSSIIRYVSKMNYLSASKTFKVPNDGFRYPVGSDNYPAAYAILKRLSEHGHPQALYQLGKMYEEGLSVKKSDKLAWAYYLKSAEQGDMRAEYKLGVFYWQGKVVDKNYRSAISWLLRSALKGGANAQYVLGYLYEFGVSGRRHAVRKDLDKARAMYSLAASQGLASAQYRLAQLYANGLLNARSDHVLAHQFQEKSFQLYQNAAKQGFQAAQIALAYFYAQEDRSFDEHKVAFQSALAGHQRGDEQATLLLALLYERHRGLSDEVDKLSSREKRSANTKAKALFRRLAKQKNAYAQFVIGTQEYARERGSLEAMSLLRQSVDRGCVQALYNLAIIAYQKEPKDEYQFIAHLKEAIKHHNSRAGLLLADFYMTERGNINLKDAANIYQTLAERGNANAELKLAYLYEQGIYFSRHKMKAIKWYQRSAQHGDPVAEYILGRMYQIGNGVDQDIKIAKTYYVRSAKKEYVASQIALGYLGQVNDGDLSLAKRWYLKAALNKSPLAQYNLSLLFLRTVSEEAYRQSFHWSLKSADQGFIPAVTHVAQMYLEGLGTKRSVKMSARWYNKAVSQGGVEALYALGLMAESGVDGGMDFSKALSYYLQAARYGSVSAEIALGRFYQFGFFVPQDIFRASIYYQKAVNNGSQFARYWQHVLSGSKEKAPVGSYCFNLKGVVFHDSSWWNKIRNNFRNKPNQQFLFALASLNRGDIQQAQKRLQKILLQHPGFTPAKRALLDYRCHQKNLQ